MSKLNIDDNFIMDSDYSTEETETGARWIDGKKIYRKVIEQTVTGSLSNNVYNFGVAISTGNENIINVYGYYTMNNGLPGRKYSIPGVSVDGNGDFDFGSTWYYNADTSYSWIVVSLKKLYQVTQIKVMAVIEYTKTTD